MKKLSEFLIPFAGLKLGKHPFEFQIDNTFFESFSFDEFESASILVKLVLEKKNNFLELSFKHQGTVNVPCDLTAEYFDLPIKGKMKMVVQFGDVYNDDNEELLILPHGEHQLDVSQFIYEMIVLSVPARKEHPGIKDGSLKSAALDKLNELKVKEIKPPSGKNETETDPRWDKLKQLLKDK